jgi:serine/threonine-protein kinase
MLASREFASSERMQRFLRFAVSECLAGNTKTLKEYTIGIEVFDRPASFDAATDPIVRVEARRLRAKLDRYYRGEGRADEIVIELPKGGYAPRFRRRTLEDYRGATEAGNRIAVLPFQNLTTAADSSYFTDGLTWELLHRLTRTKGLSVVAWNSAVQVRDAESAVAAGEKLKAHAVLTGSVRQSNDRLRIVAQLIDVSSGVYLWSETYDRRIEDLFSIQDDIAEAIVQRLSAGFASKPSDERRATHNLDAYQLYLRGRAHWNQRTSADLRRSIDLFEHAIAIDSNFAPAYAGLADAKALLADYGVERPEAVMPAARSAALRALEIDPTLGEAYCSLAFIATMLEWKWAEAEAYYRRALQLNPGYATSHHWLGCDLLALLGRLDEAMDEVEIAVELDPLSLIILEGRAYIRLLKRQFEGAADQCHAIIKTDPSFYKGHASLGRALIQLGRYDEALAHLGIARRQAGDVPSILGATGQALALRGRRDEARRVLTDLEAMGRRRYVPSTCFALIHAGLGEQEIALDYLKRGVDQREMQVTALMVHPAYDALRTHPRFNALLQRLGFVRTESA